MSTTTAYRSSILHFLDDPAKVGEENSYQYIEDGLLIVEDGKIQQVGEAVQLLDSLPAGVEIKIYENSLITPGFIDTHIHYPQTEMIAAYGEQLLDWLNTYTFPTEKQFSDKEYAKGVANVFLDELMRNGTTTALVFGTVHKESVDAFFEASEARNTRMIAGKVMMDRNAPDYLTDTPESSYIDSKELIERWHGKGRQLYAVTPRFAPTSTPEQLDQAARLLKEFPDVYMHTHLAENKAECAWVQELFPESNSYLDAYHQHNLTGKRSVFAHCIHMSDADFQCMHDTESAVAFCPTSNMFLGSGHFDLKKSEQFDVKVGMGTDIGAGTSFSILSTLNDAYKATQLRGEKLSPFKSMYLATLGGARALELDDKIGNFTVGKEADFVVLDYTCTPIIKYRLEHAKTLFDKLFVLSILGDDRAVQETVIYGESVYKRD